MPTEINVPTLGESVTSATVARWMKHEGDVVAADEPLVELETDDSPLDPPPIMISPVHWVRPELVVSVRYSEWSPDGTLRFPIFNGLRPEVHPAETVRHRPRVVTSGHVKPGSLAYDLTRFPF